MTIRLGNISGSGSFVPYSELNVVSTPAGVSGDVYDITPAVGNILRITRLSTGNTTSESGVTITITNNTGTQNILTNSTLGDSQPNGNFYIGRANVDLNAYQASLEFVDCKRIVVTKVTGNTVAPIDISYIEGRLES